MKALKVQQPFASLICTGIKDIENRSWAPEINPGKILIVASPPKIPWEFYKNLIVEDRLLEITLAQMMGIIPDDLTTLQTSAILGYVSLSDFTDSRDSCWGHNGDGNVNWKLKDAHLFKTPIPFTKGKQNFHL